MIHFSLDHLCLEQGFARHPSEKITQCVFTALSALHREGITARSKGFQPNGGAQKLVLADGTTLSFTTSTQPWAKVVAYIQPESLHTTPKASYERACRALEVACTACHDTLEISHPLKQQIHSLDLSADFVGWKRSALTEDRIRRRTRVPLDPYGATGWACNDVFRFYDKTAEVIRHPRKSYIEAIYRQAGWDPSHGNVWRAEAIFTRKKLKELSEANGGVLPSLDELWQLALDRFTLIRKPRKERGRLPKSKWHESTLWRELRKVTGWEPWSERPAAPTPPPSTAMMGRARLAASAYGQLEKASGLVTGMICRDDFAALLAEMLTRYDAKHPKAEAKVPRLIPIVPGSVPDPLRDRRGPSSPRPAPIDFSALASASH